MTAELRTEQYRIPAAALGPDSPLPPLHPPVGFAAGMKVADSVPAEGRRYLGYGLDTSCLPYGLQDDYGRERRESDLAVAVLENEVLKAVFLLDYGGRLWSLVHKPTGRELLYVNPVFQPANLAVRNAWFSGGVEWNAGVRGHSPHTCSPLFAARVEGRDGTPILRFWEWERIRGVPYQLDFRLPRGSPWLFVRVRLVNPHGVEIPMYWWSNIAVPESADRRVLAPADAAYHFDYNRVMARLPVPWDARGEDTSYTTRLRKSADFFYDIPEGQRPWIASLDAGGSGLVQTSTARLRGRKLFAWGAHAGGRNWQDFLSGGQAPYLEIQAGLARTQYECLPMPAGSEWSWVEAYGLMAAEPARVHGRDWQAACREVDRHLEETLPAAGLDAELERGAADADRPPADLLRRGSGWGALESRRRAQSGEKPFHSQGLVFDGAARGKAEAPWLALLEQGALPGQDPRQAPAGWMTQEAWRQLLQKALDNGRGDHWLSWLHLGVMEYQRGRKEAARQAWKTSLARERTAWALRNLAVLAGEEKKAGQAADLYGEALALAPAALPLLLEGIRARLDAGQPQAALDLIRAQPASVRAQGRIRTMEAGARLALGDLDGAEAILEGGLEVAGLREGEIALSDLWYAIRERRLADTLGCPIGEELKQRVRREQALPARLDFRMSEQTAPCERQAADA